MAQLDAFVAAEAAVARAHRPAQIDERLARLGRNAGLKTEQAARPQAGAIFAHGLRGAFMVPARTVGRGLHIQAVIHAIENDLRLPLRLHVAAHHAERHPRLAIAARQSRE